VNELYHESRVWIVVGVAEDVIVVMRRIKWGDEVVTG
jgi:hypothetical protein